MNSETIANAGGMLEINQLDTLLDPNYYPEEKHNFIIEMMKKFELCYAISPDRVLFPTLLPIEEPRIAGSSDDGKIIFSLYYDFLPKLVLPRLIVRMHDEIDGSLR